MIYLCLSFHLIIKRTEMVRFENISLKVRSDSFALKIKDEDP